MHWENIFYVLSSILFIFGIKKLSHPRTARSGNLIASMGMLIAIVTTLVISDSLSYELIGIGIIIGTIIGAFFAMRVKMTQMPQMVAIFNGFGGGASALVASSEFLKNGAEANLFLLISIIMLSHLKNMQLH